MINILLMPFGNPTADLRFFLNTTRKSVKKLFLYLSTLAILFGNCVSSVIYKNSLS